MRWLFVCVWVAFGCTKANPRSCADGLCTDQAFPFCDVDGTLGGSQNECIAVECDAGTFRACRGDNALVCNITGNDFDLINCPLGCDDSTGCKVCATDAECSNPTPVCDNGCRACEADDECPSRVCNGGTCVDETGVIYATSTGSASAPCTQTQPCSLAHAAAIAVVAAPQPIVRALPGVYATGFSFSTANPTPLDIVASGAAFSGFTAIEISNAANVRLRGANLVGLNFGVACGVDPPDPPLSHITLIDTQLSPGTDGAGLLTAGACVVSLTNVEMNIGSTSAVAISVGSDGSVNADRIHVFGTQPKIAMLGQRTTLQITNSILEDVVFFFLTNDSTAPGSGANFAFNTVVLTSSGNQISCDPNSGSAHRSTIFENNILFATGTQTASVISGSDCSFKNNLISAQIPPLANNTIGDPAFLSPGSRDFHLMATSPAIDAGNPTLTVFSDHDFDNTMRPKGAAPDIGAFEQ